MCRRRAGSFRADFEVSIRIHALSEFHDLYVIRPTMFDTRMHITICVFARVCWACSLISVLSQVYAPVLLAMIIKSISLRVRHEKVQYCCTRVYFCWCIVAAVV